MAELIPTGFADEAAANKTVDEQFIAFSALGFEYLSLRFIDVGTGIKNVLQLSENDLDVVRQKLDEYRLRVSSIGSPIGKTKLLDVEDDTNNTFYEFECYLNDHVAKVCEIAKKLNCKLIRGFSFYHPRGTPAEDYVEESASRLKKITEMCDSFGLTFGLEVEANLIGQNSELLMKIHSSVGSDALKLIFDGANLVTQGFAKEQVVQQFRQMQDALGWIHIKDHVAHGSSRGKYVDEEQLSGFVPAGDGESGYPEILGELKSSYSHVIGQLQGRGIEGIFADLEPHLKGGGQFGGFSGPDGFGIATRAFSKLCKEQGVKFKLRDFSSIS